MITFDESTHTYYRDGKALISVTQLMKKMGLAPDYGAVPEAVLNAKAERGKLIHKQLQNYIEEGDLGWFPEVLQFKEEMESRGGKNLYSETMICGEVVAGTIDLIYERDGIKVIADFKTTSKCNISAVCWQLSIYNYLIDMSANEGEVWWFKDDGKLTVKKIPLKPKDEIERLIAAYLAGEEPETKPVLTESQLTELTEAEKILSDLKRREEEVKKQRETIMEALKESMEKLGVTSYETDFLKITYVASYKKSTIDTKKLKDEKPEIYKEYLKESEVSPSVKIILKENKQ